MARLTQAATAPEAPPPSRETPAAFVAADGVVLQATLFEPCGTDAPPARAVVLNCGGGIPARRYRHFARFLAGHGIAVLTYDYRGVGASRPASLRGYRASIEDWSELDCAAAIAFARATWEPVPLAGIGHSIGALLFGGAPGVAALSRLVMIGPHMAQARDYRRRYRIPMTVAWHGVMPLLTQAVGFFPGRALRLGDDLPRTVALQWAWGDLVSRDQAERRERLERQCRSLTGDALVVTLRDDGFATPRGADRIKALFSGLSFETWLVTPRDYGVRGIGHFGLFRPSAPTALWLKIVAYLMLTSGLEPPPGSEAASSPATATSSAVDGPRIATHP